MKLELKDAKLKAFIVGYVTRKANEHKTDFIKQLQDKVIKNKTYFDMNVLQQIYVESVKILTNDDAISSDVNELLKYSSIILMLNDNETLDKYKVTYYFTLGLTSKEIKFNNDGSVEMLE